MPGLTLTLTDVCREPEPENSGRYTCNVVNDVGAAMSTSHVVVSHNNTRTNIYQVSGVSTFALSSEADNHDWPHLL